MKLLLIVLLATTYIQNILAQDLTPTGSNGGNTINNTPYTKLDLSNVENTPSILSLISYGSQYVLSQAYDSKVLKTSTGNYTKIFHVYLRANNSLNISATVQLQSTDGTQLVATFLARIDPDLNLKEVLEFSFEVQSYNVKTPSGSNVSWSQNNDTYKVTKFNGFQQWINYQKETLQNTTLTGNSQDYLQNFVGYKRVAKAEIYSNKTIQNSLNIGLESVGKEASSTGLLRGDLDQLGVTEIYSIYSRTSAKRGSIYRFDVELENNDQTGRAVYVVVCPNIFANNTAVELENSKYYYDEVGEFYYYYGPYITPVVNNNENLNAKCTSGNLLYYWFQAIQG